MPHDPEQVNAPRPGAPDPLAAALARLEPAPAELNRDRLMFEAGAASRLSVIRLWQFTAGVLAAVGFAAGARLYFRPPDVVERERVVYVDRVPQPEPAPAPKTADRPDPPGEPGVVPVPVPVPPDPTSVEPAPVVSLPRTQFLSGEPGTAANWFQIRNDVLTGGLGLLPDTRGRSTGPK